MIRWALTPAQTNIFVGLTNSNGAFFQYRNGTNKITQTTYTGTFKAPYFLRLVKSQDSIYSGYISADSINWQKIGEIVIQPGTITSFKAGMAVNSGDATKLSNVVFDGWSIGNTVDPLNSNVSAKESVQKNALSFTDQDEKNLKVYPNPAKKNLQLIVTFKKNKTYSSQ